MFCQPELHGLFDIENLSCLFAWPGKFGFVEELLAAQVCSTNLK